MSTLGWLASNVSSIFVIITMIEAAINVTNATFSFPNWQYTLIMLAFLVVLIFFNTIGSKVLPALEVISLIGHMAGFVVTIVALWVLCPRNSAKEVFTDIVNNSGWNNTGAACLISQVTVMYCNLGTDALGQRD